MCQHHDCIAGFIGFLPDVRCLRIINFGFGLNVKLIDKVDGTRSNRSKKAASQLWRTGCSTFQGLMFENVPPKPQRGNDAGQEPIKSLNW